MEDLIIEFKNESDISTLVELSKTFEEENICNGIVADDYDYFKKVDVAVARLKDEIIGYIHGRFEYKTENNKFFYVGQKTYYIEEMYVKKEYRNLGAGSLLFKACENYAKNNKAKWFELSTSTKDYEEVFNFYIKMMKLNYWSSYLIKEL